MKKINSKTVKALEKFSDKQLKTYSVVFFIFAVVIAVISCFIMPIGILFLLLALAIFFASNNYRKVQKYRQNPEAFEVAELPSQTQPQKSVPVPDGQMNYDLFDNVTPHGVLMYQYENNIYFLHPENFECVIGMGGKQIGFSFEEENPADPRAVMICTPTGDEIGYVNKGQMLDMLHDWDRKGWEFAGYINNYSEADRKATYKIGFYRPLDTFESKKIRLTKILKKPTDGHILSRFDCLSACSDGDIVQITHYDYSDSYVVTRQIHFSIDELGELPTQAVENLIDGRDYKMLVGVLANVEVDDLDETVSANVIVYFIA